MANTLSLYFFKSPRSPITQNKININIYNKIVRYNYNQVLYK